MAWDLSRKDWQTRIRSGLSLMPDLALHRAEADRAVAVFNKLRIPDVPDRPRLEEAAADWFREIVAALFGSIDPVSRKRMIRELFLLIAKKNSKTTNGAGLMMTALLLNQRPRAEFFFVGPTQGISDLAFDQVVGMIEADDIKQREADGKEGHLKKVLHVQQHIKRITYRGTRSHPGTGARLRIKTFSDEILTGPRPAGVMLDEIHLLGKDANAARIIGQLRGGMMSNLEAFLAMFTTQSDEPPAGVFLEELTKARMIRDGERGGDMLPILYEFPDDIMESEEWRDKANWPMVNPNLERSIYISLLESGWDDAKIKGEAEMRRFASQHFNIQIGIGLKSNAWKGAKHWEKNVETPLVPHDAVLTPKANRLRELDALLKRCEVAVIGLDGGGLDDLYGFVALGRERSTEEVDRRIWHCWAHAWCFRTVLDERKDIAPRLQDFEKDGDLTLVDDPGDDLTEIADLVEKIRDANLLPEAGAVGVDTHGLGELVDALAARDFDVSDDGGFLRGVPQGWQLKTAINTAERRIKGGRLRHNGSRLMNWCMGNAKIEVHRNAISINKQVSGTAKIDPLMALLNAVALMARNPEVGTSIYETRGLVTLA